MVKVFKSILLLLSTVLVSCDPYASVEQRIVNNTNHQILLFGSGGVSSDTMYIEPNADTSIHFFGDLGEELDSYQHCNYQMHHLFDNDIVYSKVGQESDTIIPLGFFDLSNWQFSVLEENGKSGHCQCAITINDSDLITE